MSAHTTVAPASANRLAMARPRPRPAPVTMATGRRGRTLRRSWSWRPSVRPSPSACRQCRGDSRRRTPPRGSGGRDRRDGRRRAGRRPQIRSPTGDQRERARRRRRCARAATSSIATRRSASVAPRSVGRRLGVGAEDRAGDHDRRVGVTGADEVEEGVGLRAEHRGRERDAAPAVGAVRDRDDVGVERGELLGRRRSRPGRTRRTRGSPRRGRSCRPATAGHAPTGPVAIQPSAIESPYASHRGSRGRRLDRAAERAHGPRARSVACLPAGTRARASSGGRSPSAVEVEAGGARAEPGGNVDDHLVGVHRR